MNIYVVEGMSAFWDSYIYLVIFNLSYVFIQTFVVIVQCFCLLKNHSINKRPRFQME